MITIESPSDSAGYVVWDSDVDSSIDARRGVVHGFLTATATGQRDAWMRYFYGTDAQTSESKAKADADIIEDILSKHDDYTHFCYRCDQCDRLYIQEQPGSINFREYRLDQM